MDWLLKKLVWVFGWFAKRLFNFALLLRLFALVLEREATRFGPDAAATDEAQGRIDDGEFRGVTCVACALRWQDGDLCSFPNRYATAYYAYVYPH